MRRHHPWLPTPAEIERAPSLAIVSVLDTSLDIALVTVAAAHDELHASADGRDRASSPASRAADEVIIAIQALAVALSDYRFRLLEALDADGA